MGLPNDEYKCRIAAQVLRRMAEAFQKEADEFEPPRKREPREWIMFQAHGSAKVSTDPPPISSDGYATIKVREVL